MVSLLRTLRSIRRVGLKEYVRQMWYIGDAKSGRFVGADKFGNRYFENYNAEEEIPGRHRWVDYRQHEYNASQIPSEWHAWMHHIRNLPPTEDTVLQQSQRPWQTVRTCYSYPSRSVQLTIDPFNDCIRATVAQSYLENLTGTRGAFRTYNTAAPKITAWDPKPKPRGS